MHFSGDYPPIPLVANQREPTPVQEIFLGRLCKNPILSISGSMSVLLVEEAWKVHFCWCVILYCARVDLGKLCVV